MFIDGELIDDVYESEHLSTQDKTELVKGI